MVKLIIKVGKKHNLKLKVKILSITSMSIRWEIRHRNNVILCGNQILIYSDKDAFKEFLDGFFRRYSIKQLLLNEQTYNGIT